MPWWLDNKKLDFPRGYHIEIGGGRRMPGFGMFNDVHLYNGTGASGRPIAGGGYGKQLKDDYRSFYGATVGFSGRGEMIPNEDIYCEIDPTVVDRWGIPVLRFHFKWTDYEYKQVKHMQETFRAIIQRDGRNAAVADAVEGRRLRHRARRPHHPRSGCHADGQRPADLGAEQELSGARLQEPVRRRRRADGHQSRQERDLVDSRVVDADQRIHRGSAEDGEHLGVWS